MYGKEDMLLYVGKAKNLRRRLFTYRRIKSDDRSRKTKRLVRMIRRIETEELDSEQEALLRENELIRSKKPPFNRAKKAPETYYYISAVPGPDQLVFNLRMHLREGEKIFTFGAFKGHRIIRRSLGALLRQLYISSRDIASPFMLPSRLLNKLTPIHYCMDTEPSMMEHVHEFLEGRSDRLLYRFIEHSHREKLLEKFIGRLVLRDMETLRMFYEKGPERNRRMKKKLDLESHLIPQKKLDDYLVELAFREDAW